MIKKNKQKKKKILVALSGGVDSAMAAVVLKKQGFDVRGVHFLMTANYQENLAMAKEISQQLGISLKVEDIREKFKRKVMDVFVKDYQTGRTPNPCVICNPEVKFEELIALADDLDIEKVATGHYACLKKQKEKEVSLNKAIDPTKDQSYFLYRLNQKQLARIIFPHCQAYKQKLKEEAKKLGLRILEKESQDVCFFRAEENLKRFLKKNIPVKKGKIIGQKGKVIGQHQGVAFYTIGQRQGLGLNGGPFYVSRINSSKNEIKVVKEMDHPDLWSKEVFFHQVNWINEEPDSTVLYRCKTRYLSEEISCRIKRVNKGEYLAQLAKPCFAVTSGQSIVIYEKNKVMGGGIIKPRDEQ